MITIEGLRGNGAVWTTFRLPKYDIGKIPVSAAGYVDLADARIVPFAPFECLMPPTMPEQISYPVGLSSFGPVATTIEVGSISSVDNSPGDPHPCTHTTVNGGLLYHGSDPLALPSYSVPGPAIPSVIFYDDSDRQISPCRGLVATIGARKAFNRYGVKVDFRARSNNTDLWNLPDNYLTAGWMRQIGSSIPSEMVYSLPGMWHHLPLSTSHDWDKGFCRSHRYTGRHLSLGVFDEVVDVEFHTDMSYTPASSIGPYSGRGYTKASASWHRIHRLISVQALQDAHFRAFVETTTEIEWTSWDKSTGTIGGIIPAYKALSWVTLQVLEPGLSCAGSLPVGLFDSYCQMAPMRAKTLFRAKDATASRSRAMSDVSGLDSNWIENLTQVRGTPSVFTQLLNGRAAIKCGSFEQARKFLAGAYLAYSYTIKPAISDYDDVTSNAGTVSQSISKFRYSNERRRGMVRTTSPVLTSTADLSYFTTLHLQLKDSSFATVWNAFERLGLDPSGDNLWDLIPFSFVVDWFASIGPALDVISSYNNNTLVRDVKSRIETFKVQWPLTEEDLLSERLIDFSVSTPLVYSWYDRRIYSGLGSVDPFAGQSNDGLSVSQMAQGAALLSNYR